MSDIQTRVGLVGAGHICPFHLEALKRQDDVCVLGIHDRDPFAAGKLVEQFRAGRVYRSYDELIDHADVIHVLTPPASHSSLCLRALESGCDVFVEKPLAMTEDECRQIDEAAQRLGRMVGVDHSLLLDPFSQRAQQLVSEGRIGRVLAVDCIRSQDHLEYRGGPYPEDAQEGGNPFRDLGIHSLYQIEMFLGPIQQLQWLTDHQGDQALMHFDEWRAIMRCQQGTAQLHLSWNVRPLQDLVIVQGTEGVVTVDRFGMNVTVKRQRRLPEHPGRAVNAMQAGLHAAAQVPLNVTRVLTKRMRRYQGLQNMVAEFYAARRVGRPPAATPRAAVRIAHWLDQVALLADESQRQFRRRFADRPTADTLVTGATGFIGGHLMQRLLEQRRRVRILCRRPPTDAWIDDARIDVLVGDLGNPDDVERAVEGVRTVFHVGGTVRGTEDEFWRGSVAGTQNVVNACLKHRVEQLIYVSSLSVLQAVGQEGPADESAPLEPYPQRRGLYTQTKLAAEQIVCAAVREHELPAVILRPGEVIGPRSPLLSSGIGHRLGKRLFVFGNGELNVPLIHVHDLIDALLKSEELRIRDGAIFHLVDSQVVTQNDLIELYVQNCGEAMSVHYVPKSLIYALGLCSQSAAWAVRRSSPLSLYRLRSALATRQFATNHAQNRLEWRPRRGVRHALFEVLLGVNKEDAISRLTEVEQAT